LKVNEIFGPTIQGEGFHAGRLCNFVRLSRCNLQCRWCDTPQTWVWTPAKAERHLSGVMYERSAEEHEMSIGEIVQKVMDCGGFQVSFCVISGGEPLLQQVDLVPLIKGLSYADVPVHIETAGTIMPSELLLDAADFFTVSPKLGSSGNVPRAAYHPEVLRVFAQSDKAGFKYVINSLADFDEVDKQVYACQIPKHMVQVMPQGTNADAIVAGMQVYAQEALLRGYGMSSRLHTLIWNDKRGV
jgi:7-carboxy-7-deazaguanine synthase